MFFIMNPNENRMESRAYSSLKEIFQGGRPIIFVCTPEEGRVRLLLKDIARRLYSDRMPVWSWSLTQGLLPPDGSKSSKLDPQSVLDFIASQHEPGIFHLKDFHQFMRETAIRGLRDLYGNA
jgi:hypothetical protein